MSESMTNSPLEAAERERDIVDLKEAAEALRHADGESFFGDPLVYIALSDGDRYADAIDRAVKRLEASR